MTEVSRRQKLIMEFKAFQKEHPDPETPTLVDVEAINNRIIELSKGTNNENQEIYKVAIFDTQMREDYGTEEDNPFNSYAEARRYFLELLAKEYKVLNTKANIFNGGGQ